MLEMFFKPESIAVIGASPDPAKLGHMVLRNIIEGGYLGQIYPINPKAGEILDIKAYRAVSDVEDEIDLGIIIIPAKFVLDVVKECADRGIKGVVIISAGFKETGADGAAEEKKIKAIADQAGMRIIGPNCLGLMDTESKLNASFVGDMPEPGNVAFISQSGAICSAVLDWSHSAGIGFSKFISVGNKLDVAEPDLLRALGEDDATEVIMLYAEDILSGREFMQAAAEVSRKKPIIAVKAGRTAAGAAAVSSHTGSLAGDDHAYTLALKQTGAIRCKRLADMFNLVEALAHQGAPVGKNLAVITNAGGPGVLATDAADDLGIHLSQLTDASVTELRKRLPAAASVHNPIDVLGDAMADRYGYALKTVLADENINGALVILTPQAMTEVRATAKTIGIIAQKSDKPVLANWLGQLEVEKAYPMFKRYNIPHFAYPESAVYAFQKMYTYHERRQHRKRDWLLPAPSDKRTPELVAVIERARTEGRSALTEAEARQLMWGYDLPISDCHVATNADAAVTAAETVGYPVVMKILSADVLHKSDIGALKINLKDGSAVRAAYDEIVTNVISSIPEARIDGVLIDPMITAPNREVIIGMKRNPIFGPMLMVGLGGVFVNVLKDIAFRLVPVTKEDAIEMVKSIKSYPILAGIRGEDPYDVNAVAETIVGLSQLAIDFPEIEELDINPLLLFAQGEGAIGVDVKMLLTK